MDSDDERTIVYHVHMPRGPSSLGTASLRLAILAALLCWIPYVGILAWPPGLLAVLLGGIGFLIGFLGGRSEWGSSIAGVALACVALWASFEITGGVNKANLAALAPAVAAPDVAPPPVAKKADEWIDAGRSLRLGDAEIAVIDAAIGKVPMRTGKGEGLSSNACFAVMVEITNRGEKPLDYVTWDGDGSWRSDATLHDDHGENLRVVRFRPGTVPTARCESAHLRPGESIRDILLFERLAVDGNLYKLELPGGNLGLRGEARLLIPASYVRHPQ